MAKLKGLPTPGKKLSLRRGLITYIRDGQLLAQKAHVKRGRPKSQVTRDQNDLFRQRNNVVHYMDPWAYWMAHRLTRGTQFYPRDILLSIVARRFLGTLTVDGQEVVSMATLEDISDDLDHLLGTTPGSMMFRGAQLWEAVMPPDAPAALVYDYDLEKPVWDESAAYGGIAIAASAAGSSRAATNYPTKGICCRLGSDLLCHWINFRFLAETGRDYVGRVLELDYNYDVVSIVGNTHVFTATSTANWSFRAVFNDPLELVGGTRYAFVLSAFDTYNNYQLEYHFSQSGGLFTGLPIISGQVSGFDYGWWQGARPVPQAGDSSQISTGSNPAIQIAYSIG